MKSTTRRSLTSRLALAALAGVALLSAALGAQDRLKSMPGYEHYLRMSKELPSAIRMGNLLVAWKDGGKAFEYTKDGKTWRFDIAAKAATELPAGEAAPVAPGGRGGLGGAPERGRQVSSAASPDKTLLAVYRNRNIYITDAAGANEVAVTTDGNEQARIKYGTASWVYGEELDQTTAMWWSPDGRKLAYYRFDESKVPDYYLQLDQTKLYSRMDIEAYPKSGKANPLVDLFVYDVAAKASVRIDVRGGRPFENDVVGHYAYRVSWSPDGRELLFTRANRRQNILEFTAANPDTG
ncbi:MAG TPA: DPP IV N-terminal domain-containing protein, partial [Vicinamibacterales bacterium]|nr:DPP IV N-terminal domain-containing protein [Vicinamibacterales bacterium]